MALSSARRNIKSLRLELLELVNYCDGCIALRSWAVLSYRHQSFSMSPV